MKYKCVKCKKEFELGDRIRCAYCGYRILSKIREDFRKRVDAR